MINGKWNSILLDETQTGSFGFVYNEKTLFIRNHDSLIALNSITKEILWKVKFEGDNMFGFKSIYFDSKNDIIGTITDNSHDFFLVSINSSDGSIDWKIPLGWNVHQNYGGLILKDGLIYFIEDREGVLLKCISEIDGKEVMQSDAVEIKSTGKFQGKNQTTFLIGEDFYSQSKTYAIKCSFSELSINVLDDYPCSHLFVNEKYVIRLDDNDKSILVSTSNDHNNVLGKIELSIDGGVSSIIYFENNNQDYVLISQTESFQLILINLKELKIEHTIDLPAHPIDCIYLDGKIIILCYTDEGSPILFYEMKEKTITPVIDKGVVRGGIYEYGNGFIFTTWEGLEWYTKE